MRCPGRKWVPMLAALTLTVAAVGYSAEMDEASLTGPVPSPVPGPVPSPVFSGEPFWGEMECLSGSIPALPAPFAACHTPGMPAWYFSVEGIGLKRDASDDQTFQAFVDRTWTEDGGVWTATDTVTPVLGTQNLQFGFQGGGRALVGRTLGACSAVEVSYFQVTDWNEMASVRDATEFVAEVDGAGNPVTTFPASLFSPFSNFGNPPIEGLDYNNLAYITYSSSLDNIEWNLRRWILNCPNQLQASVLVGGRYMNIGESFSYYTESAVPAVPTTNAVSTNTDNSMLGVQLGAMFEFYVDPGWWIDCEIKGAYFNNNASQTTVYENVGSPVYEGTHLGSREEDVSSWALDLRLNATFLITPRLAVCGGYQAIWFQGLALASENMSRDADVLLFGPAGLDHQSQIVYHGPHLGLTWTW
jgi:hypothetical protein